MNTNFVTASMLYNYVKCLYRVSMDLFGNPAERDKNTDESKFSRYHYILKTVLDRRHVN